MVEVRIITEPYDYDVVGTPAHWRALAGADLYGLGGPVCLMDGLTEAQATAAADKLRLSLNECRADVSGANARAETSAQLVSVLAEIRDALRQTVADVRGPQP